MSERATLTKELARRLPSHPLPLPYHPLSLLCAVRVTKTQVWPLHLKMPQLWPTETKQWWWNRHTAHYMLLPLAWLLLRQFTVLIQRAQLLKLCNLYRILKKLNNKNIFSNVLLSCNSYLAMNHSQLWYICRYWQSRVLSSRKSLLLGSTELLLGTFKVVHHRNWQLLTCSIFRVDTYLLTKSALLLILVEHCDVVKVKLALQVQTWRHRSSQARLILQDKYTDNIRINKRLILLTNTLKSKGRVIPPYRISLRVETVEPEIAGSGRRRQCSAFWTDALGDLDRETQTCTYYRCAMYLWSINNDQMTAHFKICKLETIIVYHTCSKWCL